MEEKLHAFLNSPADRDDFKILRL